MVPMIEVDLFAPVLFYQAQGPPREFASPNLAVNEQAHSHCKCVRLRGQYGGVAFPVTLVIP